jgi:hypothetical protein
MSQDLTTRKFTRRSLSEPRSARTVLLRMAEDQERADRLRALKDEYPSVTWRQLAEHVGVRERSVLNWAAGKGMDYDHAVKVAEFFRELGAVIADDYVWRGLRADTPTPFAGADDVSARLAALEGMMKALLHDQERVLRILSALPATTAEAIGRLGPEDGRLPSRDAEPNGSSHDREAS